MAASQLIFQRDDSLVLTPGSGREQLLDIVRACAQLRAVVADSWVFDVSTALLWGAAARGATAESIIQVLDRAAATPLPVSLAKTIAESMGRYGRIWVRENDNTVELVARESAPLVALGLTASVHDGFARVTVSPRDLPRLRIEAAHAGWPIALEPIRSEAMHHPTARLTSSLRQYQQDAVDAFLRAGSGLVLLPCGAGKTMVGAAVTVAVGGKTLIVVPSRSVATQWRATLLSCTTLRVSDIVGVRDRRTAPVVIATYHAIANGRHTELLGGQMWDLIIYDEVQSLPADMFRKAAEYHSVRRLGLTATLVREDGREREITALVGPPLYDIAWSELERQGWISPAQCIEIRLPPASTPADITRFKLAALQRLLFKHRTDPVIVAGTALAPLRAAGTRLGFPVLTGASSHDERERLMAAFRAGTLPVLGLSRIGSVGLDLPNARVLVQISGTFGSRQEEAQRLGRLLRPQPDKTATFYTLVAGDAREKAFAARRQRFLVAQGYRYDIVPAHELPRPSSTDQVL